MFDRGHDPTTAIKEWLDYSFYAHKMKFSAASSLTIILMLASSSLSKSVQAASNKRFDASNDLAELFAKEAANKLDPEIVLDHFQPSKRPRHK
jgi:hypothetical protein